MHVKELTTGRALKLGITNIRFDQDSQQVVASAPAGKTLEVRPKGAKPVRVPCIRAHSWATMYDTLKAVKIVEAG